MEQAWYNPFELNGHDNILRVVAQENGINADDLIDKISNGRKRFNSLELTKDELTLLEVCRFKVTEADDGEYFVNYDFSGNPCSGQTLFSKNII